MIVVATGMVLARVLFSGSVPAGGLRPYAVCGHSRPSAAGRSSVGSRLPTFGSSRGRTWQADAMCRTVEMRQSQLKGDDAQEEVYGMCMGEATTRTIPTATAHLTRKGDG